MSKLNFLVFLNSYEDSVSNNSPSMANFKWNRAISSLPSSNPLSQSFSLAPGESRSLFSGTRTLLQDGTTVYSLSLKPLTTNTYVLQAVSGTLPDFRTPRAIASDATTQVTVTVNGEVATFTSTAGTNFNFGTTQVGDFVRFGNLFNTLNQGEFKVIAKTATSISVENDVGYAEGPITLGSGFASQVQVYSALGVQINDTLIISGGFSLVTQGSYVISGVSAESVEFFSTEALPQESNIMTQAVTIYSQAKQLVYMEADNKCAITMNGSNVANIEPFIISNSVVPGVFMLKSTIYSLSIVNNSTDVANVFLASVE